MKDETVWFGYLEAGEKSSPVARDSQLETNKPSTMYLYNLNRQQFIEYSREIVEPKLREFKASEKAVAKELESAFKKARKDFKGKGGLNLAKASSPPPPAPKKEPVEATADVADSDDDIFDDDDWDNDE